MPNTRISLLIALDASDDGLKRTLTSAERSLGELAGNAKSAGEKAASGLAQVQAGMSAFGEQIERAKGQLLAFVGVNWALGKLQEIVQVADAWNMMNARLKLATAGSREFAVAQQELFGIAQRIGVPIEETAILYGKLQQAVRMLGGEQKDALSITEGISQALRLSGASANEAQAVLLQFGQALASGVLRGEEFNSVVENSPRLAQALADGLNVPIGRLRKMAEEGRLTADVVVGALLSQKDRLAAEYAQLPQTVSQSFERLKNAFAQWVGKLDASTGLTKKLAEAMTWLAQNLDTVMQWLTRIAEVGLAVLVYRMIPALITAWETAAAAAVMSAQASAAAWATANLSMSQAVATTGKLKTGFALLAAFLVGWEIGTWLSEKFEIVRKAGIFMVQVLMTAIEELQFHWEVFAAIFTSDTISQAIARHQARAAEMKRTFSEMYADAADGADKARGAINTAASAAEEISRRLAAVRQGTQEATGRGVEALHAALDTLKSRIGEVEQAMGKANQTVSDATAKMAEAYKGLTAIVETGLQQQIAAIRARYQEEQSALELSRQSESARITQSTQLLTDALTRQTTLRQQATTDTLKLIESESAAKLEAAKRQGQSEEEHRANVVRVENEVLAAKRQTLTTELSDYRSHVDALNAEANRHLSEVKRIEGEKRQLSMSTEERIRDIQRQSMSDFEATEDRKRQIAEYESKARAALAAGEFEQARQYGQKAMDLAAQVASTQASEAQRAQAARKEAEQGASQVAQLEAQARQAAARNETEQAKALTQQAAQLRTELAQKSREADAAAAKGKEGLSRAIDGVREAQSLLNQTLDAESKAHQQAAQSALSAQDDIRRTLNQTQTQIEAITAQLREGFKITLDADSTRFEQALATLDKALTEKARLVAIQVDLSQAEQKLREFEQALKEGKTLDVDADVTKAKDALEKLNAYAKETAQVDLKVGTEKAQAAITNLDGQLRALDRIQTESQHVVSTNAEAARAQIQSLNGINTSSTHTIHVQKVETNATGGLVGNTAGETVRAFASGGAVAPAFPRMSGGTVPGSGNGDTVPRTLDAGAFVIRKAAVQKYGSGALANLAKGVAHFATGGRVRFGGGSTPGASPDNESDPPKHNRDAAEALKMIELGMQGMDDYTGWLSWNFGANVSQGNREKTLDAYGKQAQRDRQAAETLLSRKQLTPKEQQTLATIKETWQQAMAQPLLWGKDLGRDLIDYMDAHQGEFFRGGGLAKSDTVPAMLTPGEYVVNKDAVSRYGVGFFETINRMAAPAAALAQRAQGFATGGLVQPLAGLAARASHLVAGLPSLDLGAQLTDSLAAAMRAPALASASADPTPARTIRVELASANRTVAASINARDEAALLDLLKEAQSRAF